MDERCFRPLLCTVKAELGRGQPGLMRWIWDETLPQSSIDRSTFYSAAHRLHQQEALMSVSNFTSCFQATVLCDIVTLYFLKRGTYYKEKKYMFVEDADAAPVSEIIMLIIQERDYSWQTYTLQEVLIVRRYKGRTLVLIFKMCSSFISSSEVKNVYI